LRSDTGVVGRRARLRAVLASKSERVAGRRKSEEVMMEKHLACQYKYTHNYTSVKEDVLCKLRTFAHGWLETFFDWNAEFE